jgi:hypothetical protein
MPVSASTFNLRCEALEPPDAGPVEARLVGTEQETDRERVLRVDALELAGRSEGDCHVPGSDSALEDGAGAAGRSPNTCSAQPASKSGLMLARQISDTAGT